MACEVTGFCEQFPGAVDIVLVKSERWTEYHKAIMEALTEGVRMFLRRRKHLSFEQFLDEFKECQAVRSERRIASLPVVWFEKPVCTSTTTKA